MTSKVLRVVLVVLICAVYSNQDMRAYLHYKCNRFDNRKLLEVVQWATLIGPYNNLDIINKNSPQEGFFHLMCRVRDNHFQKGCIVDENVIKNTKDAFEFVLDSNNLTKNAYGSDFELKWTKHGKWSVFNNFALWITNKMKQLKRKDFCGDDFGKEVLNQKFGSIYWVLRLIRGYCPYCLFRLGENCKEIIERIQSNTKVKNAGPGKKTPSSKKPGRETEKTSGTGTDKKINIADKVTEPMEYFAVEALKKSNTCKTKT